MSTPLRHVGKIKEAHGIRGEVFFLIFSKDLSWTDNLQHIYVGDQPDLKKYIVKKIREHKEGLILTLEDVLTRNQSEELSQNQVWVDQSLFESADSEPPYLLEIENFEVVDKSAGVIGVIQGFSWNGSQDILLVKNQTNQDVYDIPFVDAYVEKIDSENKQIFTNLPEGLLEINSTDSKFEKPDDQDN